MLTPCVPLSNRFVSGAPFSIMFERGKESERGFIIKSLLVPRQIKPELIIAVWRLKRSGY